MKNSFLGIKDWNARIKETGQAFPKLWWRIASINLLTMFTIIVGTIFLVLIWLVTTHTDIKELLWQLQQTGKIDSSLFWVFFLFVFVWIFFVFVFGILGKIANWITLKNYTEKKIDNPFFLYFKHSWKYFFSYIGTGFFAYWPLVIAMILVLISVAIDFTFVQIVVAKMKQLNTSEFLPMASLGAWAIALGSFVIGIAASIYLIYRAFQILFSLPYLIYSHKSIQKTLQGAKMMVKGNWWRVFFSIFVFAIIIGGISNLFSIPEYLMKKGFIENNEVMKYIFGTVDTLFSLCVLAPLTISFVYFLMLFITKTKKIK